jgi:pantoate kinase
MDARSGSAGAGLVVSTGTWEVANGEADHWIVDKVSKSQDAQMRALVALQGLGSMSPEHLEKLNFAMELVNNEPLFRQM